MQYLRPLMAVASLGLASAAYAGGHTEGGPPFEEPQGWSAGIGVIGSSGIYAGEDRSAMLVPTLRYSGDRFSASVAQGLRYSFYQGGDLTFEAILAPRFNAIGGSDAAELAGLDRAEITADGGLGLSYGFGFGTELSVSAITELTSERGGTEVTLGVDQPIPLGPVPLFLEAGAVWQDGDLSEFLYGVYTTEATVTRSAYAPGDIVVPYLAISTAIPITDNVSAFASVSAEFLPSEVTDSPIIDEDIGVDLILAVTYNF